MKRSLLSISIIAGLFLVFSMAGPGSPGPVSYEPEFPEDPPFLYADSTWVDSVMEELSMDERIGQMMMVAAYSNRGEEHIRDVLRTISRHNVGGVVFFQGGPRSQARMTNRFQAESEVPLLVAIDGETGLGFRLDSTLRYPSQMTLGSLTDHALIYRLGQDMARQMKRLGIHMNFAPVADINNNPANPVINIRSFGEERNNVAVKTLALMRGMQEGGLLVTAKHFPGHGDTDTDSHYALPVLPFTRDRLDSLELYPFREAIPRGLTGVMVAHLQVPALDDRPNRPTSVSGRAVRELLKKEMGFRGLVVTDALNMRGLSEYYEPGLREVEAVKAGNDILLMPSDPGKAIHDIRRAVRRGEIPEEQINQSCRKILLAKAWSGVHRAGPVRLDSLMEDLHLTRYKKLQRQLVEGSLILARNRDSLLPLKNLEQLRLATVTIGEEEGKASRITDRYLEGDHFSVPASPAPELRSALSEDLREYNAVIVSLLETSRYASRNYGISDEAVALIESLPDDLTLIFNLAGAPYTLGRFETLEHMDAVIVSHDDGPLYQEMVYQAIFGGRPFTGRMPVAGGTHFLAGDGIPTGPPVRLGFAPPFEVDLNPDTLVRMEEVILEAFRMKAMPGCQLVVARDNKVVWDRAYGHHTFQRRQPVKDTDLYDLASLTKILATVPSLMRLRDQGLFHEDSLLGSYGVVPDTSNKDSLRIADVLSHQAGLVPWLPFYHETLEPLDTSLGLFSRNWSHQYPLKMGPSDFANAHVKFVDSLYQRTYSPGYPLQVAGDLFLRSDLRDTLYHRIYASKLLEPEYRYSDLGYYLLHPLIEQQSDTMLYPYVWYTFYAPMGARRLGYLPLNRFDPQEIVPTENDLFFRRQLLRGYVHDPGAAMLGGIAGHAGLFGNALDVAKMMQMFLNGGTYGGRRFIDSLTVATYTACYDCENENRRGLGFDRPITDEPDAGPACDDASELSFGHSGFTGTIAWADPAYDLVYVLLANRIHPAQGNTLMIDENIRTRIQQVIYDAIITEP